MALTQVSTGGIKDGQVQTADLADGQVTVGKLHADALDHTYTLGADGSNHYTFTGEGLTGAVNDPTLYLTRGKTYRFVNGNSAGAHPFRIQTTVNGSAGTEYNTGVTNNGGAGGSTIVFEVPHDAPDVLYYQCTSHGSMGGILYVTGALADGTVTTAKIADEAVTLAKLPHGTSSNDGKFLRANNGADPTFETVDTTPSFGSQNISTTGTLSSGDITISSVAPKITFTDSNDNPDYLVQINGGGLLVHDSTNTADRIKIDSSGNLGIGTTAPSELLTVNGADKSALIRTSSATGTAKLKFEADGTNYGGVGLENTALVFRCDNASANNERMRIDSSGKVKIGTTDGSPHANADELTLGDPSGTVRGGMTINSGANKDGSIHFGDPDSNSSGQINYDHNTDALSFYTAGSKRIRIDSDGLKFGVSAGSHDALDDYEEGTFTASLGSSGGGASFNSGGTGTGYYVKVGSNVSVQIYFSGANIASAGSGVCIVSGLPFTSNSSSYYTMAVTHTTMTVGTLQNGYVQYGNTYFVPVVQNGTGGSALNVGNPRYMMIGGWYPIAF